MSEGSRFTLPPPPCAAYTYSRGAVIASHDRIEVGGEETKVRAVEGRKRRGEVRLDERSVNQIFSVSVMRDN